MEHIIKYDLSLVFFIFDSNYENNKEYLVFLNDLTSYMKEGTNDHKKDAIDVLCSAAKIIKLKYAKYLYS